MWIPPELNTIQDNADVLHEMYESLRKAGFTESQAMHLIMQKPCCEQWCREND
jgi:hypothetical protein